MKALEVKPLPNYKLFISFDDGVNGTIELGNIVGKGVFKVLQDEEKFKKVYSTAYSIAWSDELEIDLRTVYSELGNKDPKELILTNSQHAAD
jgi:hypothetical protein